MKTIYDIIKEFDEMTCPCRWIITTPEHKKKDCPHYTFADEHSFLSSKLQEWGEQERRRGRGEAVHYIGSEMGLWQGTQLDAESVLRKLPEVLSRATVHNNNV
ncbi:MAG: hypothetical protein ACYDAK_13300 [Candidatus Limnocylindrales bacterium]